MSTRVVVQGDTTYRPDAPAKVIGVVDQHLRKMTPNVALCKVSHICITHPKRGILNYVDVTGTLFHPRISLFFSQILLELHYAQ